MNFFQFFKFSVVGSMGYVVDVATFYLTHCILGSFFSRLFSFGVAVVFTYVFNRALTFRYSTTIGSFWRQFPSYFLSMTVGGVVNLVVFFILNSSFLFFIERAYLAIAFGSFAGLFVNYFLSSQLFHIKKT